MLSPEYRAQLAQLHADKSDFGTSSAMYAGIVRKLIAEHKPRQLLDFGCGKMALKPFVDCVYIPYDPAIAGIDAKPAQADMVVCTDVLEHVEPEYLDSVLDELQRVTRSVGFFVVHTGPAMNHLPDGRNAHLIQEPPEWWLPKIVQRWKLMTFQRWPNGFFVVVA